VAILAAFAVLRFLVVRETRNSLLQAQISEFRSSIEQYAVEAESVLRSSDGEELYSLTRSWSEALGGRVLVSDSAGVIQADAFSQYNGVRLELTDLNEVLMGNTSFSYSYYWLQTERPRGNQFSTRWLQALYSFVVQEDRSRQLVVYMATPIVSGSSVAGAVVASVSVQTVMDRISVLEFEMTLLTLAVGVFMLFASILISNSIIRPLGDVLRGLRRIGGGDFVHRIPVRGHSEFGQISSEINDMTEKLEAQEQVRRDFISNASHELKTPLSTIKILVQSMLTATEPDPEMNREFMQDIDNEVDRMSALVGDLLDLVKNEGAQRIVDPELLDFSAICRSVLDRLAPTAANRSQELRGDIPDSLMMMGDAPTLERMVLNVTDNALKYTPEGGHVTMKLVRRSHRLILTVEDDGIGIGEEEQKHIFERFYRVDKARSRQTGGTGLGLAIVKEIAQTHGGTVGVESQLGKGTKMTITLPEAIPDPEGGEA